MKNCPTSNMNRSQFWGFEVSHIIISFTVLAVSNVMLNIFKLPLILSWVFGLLTLGILRVISHGQKNGHLELLARYVLEPHVYLGHAGRKRSEK
ncbi:MAG: hypothetical protein EOP05_01245 [Proteobacteria bacterium]|nr:MAG: hypothetical protein EOP05_01245 [Pseudomonadota bacterium]